MVAGESNSGGKGIFQLQQRRSSAQSVGSEDSEDYSSADLSEKKGPRHAPASPIVAGCSILTRAVGRQGTQQRQSRQAIEIAEIRSILGRQSIASMASLNIVCNPRAGR